MSSTTTPIPAGSESSVVRALLITDLVDSTRLIERLGDRRAARLLAQEEEAARGLAQRYAGQEIDRSDGFLFIFMHAWQAVGFALDYHRALEELSVDLPLSLQGRVGIHVGETYLVPNTAENVARGAKQVEVSGLAKPIAARLMSAAHPGQTLLSGTAHDLAMRPCADHLPPEPPLHWVTLGAYLLKGIDQPMQVFSVGHDQRLAAREPLENEKVRSLRRRERRRFLLSAAGVATAAALPTGYWLWKRNSSQNWESQWLVIADWNMGDADAGLGNVLATAFRIALQQSRFAFVMDSGAVQAALLRMRGVPPVDRDKSVEIARRESAAAAVVPAFASFEGGILLSVEVVEAVSARTVAAAQEQFTDLVDLTQAIDRLAAKIRSSIGEPDLDIQRNAQPLAKVTTANLEALRLYSESDALMQQRKDEEAIAALERAIVLDPEFASALAKLGTLHTIRRSEPSTAARYWSQAASIAGRLTPREQMYVDGCLSWNEDPMVMRARWSAMATAFPDDAPAVNNAAFVEWTQFGDFVAAERGFRRGTEIPHRWNYILWHHMAYAQLGQGKVKESRVSFEESLKRAEHPAHCGAVRACLVDADLDAAQGLLDRFRGSGGVNWQVDQIEAEILLLAYRGKFEEALALGDSLRELALRDKFRTAERIGLRNRMWLSEALGKVQDARAAATTLRQVLAPELHSVSNGAIELPPFEALMLAALAERRGWSEVEANPDALLAGRWSRFPLLQAAALLALGWRALREGRAEEALRLATEGRDQAQLFALFELEIAAYEKLGQHRDARDRARRARGLLAYALAENHNHFSTHLPNLLIWQRLEKLAEASHAGSG